MIGAAGTIGESAPSKEPGVGSVLGGLVELHRAVRRRRPETFGPATILAFLLLVGSIAVLARSDHLVLWLAQEKLIDEATIPTLRQLLPFLSVVAGVVGIMADLRLVRWITHLSVVVLSLLLIWVGLGLVVGFRLLGGEALLLPLARMLGRTIPAMARGAQRLATPVGTVIIAALVLLRHPAERAIGLTAAAVRAVFLAVAAIGQALGMVIGLSILGVMLAGRALAGLAGRAVAFARTAGRLWLRLLWHACVGAVRLVLGPSRAMLVVMAALGKLAGQGLVLACRGLVELGVAVVVPIRFVLCAVLAALVLLARAMAAAYALWCALARIMRRLWLAWAIGARGLWLVSVIALRFVFLGIQLGWRIATRLIISALSLLLTTLRFSGAVLQLVARYMAGRALAWESALIRSTAAMIVVAVWCQLSSGLRAGGSILGALISWLTEPVSVRWINRALGRLGVRFSDGEPPQIVPRALVVPYVAFWTLLLVVMLALLVPASPLLLTGFILQVTERRFDPQLRLRGACRLLFDELRLATNRTRASVISMAAALWTAITWPVQHPGEVPKLTLFDPGRRRAMEGRPIWLWAAGGVLVFMVLFGMFGRELNVFGQRQPPAAGAAPAPPPDALVISMASGGNKEEWLHQAVGQFNEASPGDPALQVNGKRIFVQIIQETLQGRVQDYRSGTMIDDTLNGKIQPTILSPGEESWIYKFQKEWQGRTGKPVAQDIGPTLIRSPLVIVTWQSRARALGCWPDPEPGCTWERIHAVATSSEGWGVLGQPEWGQFKFGYGYAGESNSGTLTAISMCAVGAGKATGLTLADVGVTTGCGQFIAGIERAKIHSGTRSDWLVEQMTSGGPEYLDAIIGYEFEVIAVNKNLGRTLREPLVAIYPQDGTIVVGQPFTILEGLPWVTPQQVAAARVLQKYLLSPEQQRAVLALGFRPADPIVPIGSPIDPAYGVNPAASINALEVPETAVIDQIVDVWHRVKKHAVVALVFDKSGSMAGAKMGAAIKGAQGFACVVDRDDRLIWQPFDSQVYPQVEGSCEELSPRITATPAGGETALFDAVVQAYDYLQSQRSVYGSGRKYGMVILSDGKDNRSRTTLPELESRLRPAESDPNGVQIHTIAIGDDADESVLKKISNAAHGRFWKGETVEKTADVYRDIAKYY